MSGEFTPGDGRSESEPIRPEQIETMAALVDSLMDGTLALAGKSQKTLTNYLHGDLFHDWLARYDNNTGNIEPLGADEIEELSEDPRKPLESLPEERTYNHVGLSIDMPRTHLESLMYWDEEALTCTIAHIEDPETPDDDDVDNTGQKEVTVTEARANYLLDIACLLDISGRFGDPFLSDDEVARSIRKDIAIIEHGSTDEAVVSPNKVLELKTSLLEILAQTSVRAHFRRTFEGDGNTSLGLSMQIDVGQDGSTSKNYHLQTKTPIETAPDEVLITSLEWEDTGSNFQYRQYVDIDFEGALERRQQDNPEHSINTPIEQLLQESMKKRHAEKEVFASEQAQGFHQFSEADADRIIRMLGNPGEITIG